MNTSSCVCKSIHINLYEVGNILNMSVLFAMHPQGVLVFIRKLSQPYICMNNNYYSYFINYWQYGNVAPVDAMIYSHTPKSGKPRFLIPKQVTYGACIVDLYGNTYAPTFKLSQVNYATHI